MFWIVLALKRLAQNARRTLFKTLFFSLLFAAVLCLLLFLGGTDAQMKSAMRVVLGDAGLSARNAMDDIAPMAQDIRNRYGDALAGTQEFLAAGTTLIADRAVAACLSYGAQADFADVLARAAAWKGKAPAALEPGGIYLEATVARSIACVAGDFLTVQWSDAESGRMNTERLEVRGVFVGSGLLFSGTAYLNLDDMQRLLMDPGRINQFRLSFKERDEDSMRRILREINAAYYDLAEISSITLDPTGGRFGVYKYYNLLVAFVAWSLIAVFFVIMGFSNQNIYLAEYRGRRQELVAFMAFGMESGEIRKAVIWEALIQFALGLAGASALSLIATLVAGTFRISDVRYADIITAMGGPRIAFAPEARLIIPAVLLMALIMTASALKGANNYLNREIRDIAGTTE
jgi:ABC-type lipoprotein release transport system permease subunit